MLSDFEILKQVNSLEIRTRRRVNELTGGAYHSVFKGTGMEFHDVREYYEGDDVRDIDWNVTARSGKPHIKRYTEERELTVMIACDISASVEFGSNKTKMMSAAELAALLTFSAMRNKDKVGLMLYSDCEEMHLQPKKGKQHGLRLLREMLIHERSNLKTDTAKALKRLQLSLKRKSIVFLISDLLDRGFDKELKFLARKHDLIVINICDSMEENFPRNLPGMYFQDAENEQICRIGRAKHGYENKQNLLEKNRRLCLQAGADLLVLRSGEDPLQPLMRFFKMRVGRQ